MGSLDQILSSESNLQQHPPTTVQAVSCIFNFKLLSSQSQNYAGKNRSEFGLSIENIFFPLILFEIGHLLSAFAQKFRCISAEILKTWLKQQSFIKKFFYQE